MFIKSLLLLTLSLFGSTISFAHNHSMAIEQKQTQPTMQLAIQKIINTGVNKIIFVKLTDMKTNKPIRLQDLKQVHTQKIHMLIIDDSLSDYSHIHPIATKEPGVYQFSWQPRKKDANYRIWADLVSNHSQQQEYIVADLYKTKSNFSQIIPSTIAENTVEGYQFKLSFDQPKLVSGKAAMGKIEVSDAQGNPVHSLEPVMGAYAHIVGFSDDFNTVIHIHPMGSEPTKTSDRGGPVLDFHIEPPKAGTIKLFVQVKINGKELFVPFSYISS